MGQALSGSWSSGAPSLAQQQPVAVTSGSEGLDDSSRQLVGAVDLQHVLAETRRLCREVELLREAVLQLSERVPLVSTDLRINGYEGPDGVVHPEQAIPRARAPLPAAMPARMPDHGVAEQRREAAEQAEIRRRAALSLKDADVAEQRAQYEEADRLERARRDDLARARRRAPKEQRIGRSQAQTRLEEPAKASSRTVTSGSRAGGRNKKQDARAADPLA